MIKFKSVKKLKVTEPKITKQHVKDAFNELCRCGYRVIHFSFRKFLPKSLKDLPDIMIIGKGQLTFVEVKLYRDELTEGQEQMGEMLSEVNGSVYYYVVNQNDYLAVRDSILKK